MTLDNLLSMLFEMLHNVERARIQAAFVTLSREEKTEEIAGASKNNKKVKDMRDEVKAVPNMGVLLELVEQASAH